MLSRIERGLVSPSVETLDRIANGLGVPVSRFFSDQTSRTDFSFVPAGKGIRVDRVGAVAGYRYELLGHQLSGNMFVEPYLVTLLPEAETTLWLRGLPQDSAELFTALLAMAQGELVRLLAVCEAATVDVVTPRATARQPGAELAQAVGLDMAEWWKPTADGYFQHVPKAAILEAVDEFAPSHATRLAKLKKADIASEAERLADGTGWMPAVFKSGRDTEPQEGAEDVGAPEDAADEVEAHALAA